MIDPADTYERNLRSIMAPDPDGDIVDWLEANVKSMPGAMPGIFRVESTPYLAPILRAMCDPEIQTIVVFGAVQMGKSTLLELWSAYIAGRAPGPTLMLQDVDQNAKDWRLDRLKHIWDHTPAVRSRISTTEKSNWHTNQFQRCTMWVLGAENKRNLQRRSIRYLGGDEVWLWKKGHLNEALRRRTAFTWNGKSVFISQGGHDGDDITNLWNITDRREWMFRCLACDAQQGYEFDQLIYPEGAKGGDGWDVDKVKAGVKYKCKSCGHMHDDSFVVRTEMNNKGEFVPMNTSAPKGMVGFHWNALCGQWGMSWGSLAEEAIMAKKAFDEHGDETSRIEFKQKRLAVSWSDEPDDGGGEIMPSGYRLADVWVDEGAMVDGKLESAPITDDHRKAKIFARLRFMQVDVQRKGYYIVVRSWSSDGKSRMVYWGYVETDDQLRDVQVKYEVANFFTFLDSGDGPNTDSVYRLCARFGWNATKGSGQNEFAWRVQTPYGIKVAYRPYQRAKVIQVGAQSCKLYVFSNLVFKDSLSRLRRAGHHTYPEDAGDEYRKQMQSEHRTKNNAGTPIWVPVGDRANHLWDCEVMGILPAMMAKLIGKGKNRGATPTPEDEKPVKESTESP
jgi:phage terminase large subunit GpA-like protein